jgi:hypothetical protein
MNRLGGTFTFERAKVKERLQTVHESPNVKTSHCETSKRVNNQIPGRDRAVSKVVEKNVLRESGIA